MSSKSLCPSFAPQVISPYNTHTRARIYIDIYNLHPGLGKQSNCFHLKGD